jgi:hypothetical protein
MSDRKLSLPDHKAVTVALSQWPKNEVLYTQAGAGVKSKHSQGLVPGPGAFPSTHVEPSAAPHHDAM